MWLHLKQKDIWVHTSHIVAFVNTLHNGRLWLEHGREILLNDKETEQLTGVFKNMLIGLEIG